jgi:capsular polysaccharide biosynthesis protein
MDTRGIARLPGGRVYGSGIVITPDGCSIIGDLTHDFGGKTGGRHWLNDYKSIRPPVPVIGRTAVVAVNLGSRYAHWLLEELPRLLSINEDDAESVIANTGEPFIHEVHELAQFPWRVVPVARHSHFSCESLVIPPLADVDGHTVNRIKVFAHRQLGAVKPGLGEKIYLSREKAGRRRVTNEGELWARLEPHGFNHVHSEVLSWRDQVAMFATARVVVAPHGAGLANLVFCRPGTRVVEFFHPDYVNPSYERLSKVAGLDYRRAMAQVDCVEPCDPRSGRLDITADVITVLAAATGD